MCILARYRGEACFAIPEFEMGIVEFERRRSLQGFSGPISSWITRRMPEKDLPPLRSPPGLGPITAICGILLAYLRHRVANAPKFESQRSGDRRDGWVRNPGVQCNPTALRPGTRGIHGEDALGPWVRRSRGLEIQRQRFCMEPRRHCLQ